MAKRSSKPKRKSPSPRRKAALRASLWVAVCGLLLVALCVGARALWAAAMARQQFRVKPTALSIGSHPEWVRGPALAAVLRRQLSSLPDDASLFEPHLADDIREALSSCPWVCQVTRVERRLPNRINLGAIYRKPAGMVLYEGKRYFVDRDGYWLPEEFFDRPAEWAGRHIPLIVDRYLKDPPPIGRSWNHPKLAVGARLTESLRVNGALDRPHLTAIDVSRVGQDTIEPEIVLTAASGAQVRWGRSSAYEGMPGLARPASEPQDVEKLRMLMSRLERYPGLTGIGDGYLDLRVHGQLVIGSNQ